MNRAIRLLSWSIFSLAAAGTVAASSKPQDAKDNDQTLRAMRDEMERAKSRLELNILGVEKPVRPYYIEYRLLDRDVVEVTGEFGALLNSAHTRNRFMNVEARVGD